MRFSSSMATALLATAQHAAAAPPASTESKHFGKIAPKVMIVSLVSSASFLFAFAAVSSCTS